MITEIPTQTVALRKFAASLGLKGLSSANKATLTPIVTAKVEELNAAETYAAEREAELAAIELESTPNVVEAPKAKRGICTDCGRKEDFRGSQLCTACREYAEDENLHSDNGHGVDAHGAPTGEYAEDCRVCHPELDERSAKPEGTSRIGMVIVAKGTEVHKSQTFKAAAEALGWTVYTAAEVGRYYATATRGGSSISLAWEGRRYDYPASSAQVAGKTRKVRNLKEALRILADA